MSALALEMPGSSPLPLRPYQEQAIDAAEAAYSRGVSRPLIVLPTGCHRAGQHVLMHDGSTKAVEDIQVGDRVMGPGSQPRIVLRLERGTGPMMTIQPVKGEPWVVNDEHILTLVETQEKGHGRYPSQRGGTVRDVDLRDWWQWSRYRKHRHKLFRVPADFPSRPAPALDPYFFGVVLGDGTLAVDGRLSVTTVDPEIVSMLGEIAASYGLQVRREGIQYHLNSGRPDPDGHAACPWGHARTPANTYTTAQGHPVCRVCRRRPEIARQQGARPPRLNANPVVDLLRGMGLNPIACEDRFIPDDYRLGSRGVRLNLLAGLLDSDGSCSKAGYDFGSKSERLAHGTAFIARSVGLAAYVAKRPSGHYRVSISGDCSVIPCRIPRKIASPRLQKKDVLRTGFQVIPTGTVEAYYGFTLSGDGRYLLDDFTVTHNCGKTVCFAHLAHRRPGRVLVIAHREELIQQAAAKLAQVSGSMDIGIVKAARDEHGAQTVVASVQTLAAKGRAERVGKFGTVIVDEAHHAVAASYLDVLGRLGCMDDGAPLTVGFTATAGRSDKLALGAVWQEIAYQRGIVQMIAESYLCDIRAIEVGSDFDLGNVQVSRGDFTDESLGQELERSGALEAAAVAYVRHAKDRPGVAFTPTIATAHELARALSAKGIPAGAVDGTMPAEQRRSVLRRLHSGELQVVANAQILTEGWDEPAVSCALMLRPTKSAPFFTQMVGRVLRPFVGKTDALLLDVAGASELGLATIADLAGLSPGSVKNGKSLLDAAEEQSAAEQRKIAVAAARTRQVELLRRSELRWIGVDGSWVLPAGADEVMILTPRPGDDADEWDVWRCPKGGSPRMESGKPLALDWARGVGEEIARAHGGVLSQAKAAWRDRPASAAQVSALQRAGLAVKAGTTRGEASDLMTAHYAAKTIKRLRKAAR